MKKIFLTMALLGSFPLFSMDSDGRSISYEQAWWRIKRAFLTGNTAQSVHVNFWAVEKAFTTRKWKAMSFEQREAEVKRLEKLGKSSVGN